MIGGVRLAYLERGKMNRYFKKSNGMRFKYDPMRHKLDSLKERFEECDENGMALKKPKKSSKDKEK